MGWVQTRLGKGAYGDAVVGDIALLVVEGGGGREAEEGCKPGDDDELHDEIKADVWLRSVDELAWEY